MDYSKALTGNDLWERCTVSNVKHNGQYLQLYFGCIFKKVNLLACQYIYHPRQPRAPLKKMKPCKCFSQVGYASSEKCFCWEQTTLVIVVSDMKKKSTIHRRIMPTLCQISNGQRSKGYHIIAGQTVCWGILQDLKACCLMFNYSS